MNKYKPYRNKFEQDTATALSKLSVPYLYEDEKIDYTVSGTYLCDFKVATKNGKTIFIETKGNGRSFDQHTKQKMIAVKEQHPEIDIRIVFYSNGKIGPKRKDGSHMTQSDWAKKHGFDYAIREVPQEWLDE